MAINEFIASEKIYFEPMLARQSTYTKEQLDVFRRESVHQRRERVSSELYEQLNGVVKYGPFKGLSLGKKLWWGKGDLGSMCLGLYEIEILNFFYSKELEDRKNFIDIGAADGYYAIGLLYSGRVNSAVCFELSESGRSTIHSNWMLNGEPGELKINGNVFDNFEEKTANIDFSKAFVLVDIEGAEFSFLTSEMLSYLKKTFIVIEIHNWVENFIDEYSNLLKRADEYFDVTILDRVERSTFNFEELRSYTDDNRLLLTSEARPCNMRFLVLKPR